MLDLLILNNEATDYQVEAVYFGDNALNLTGMATSPDSTYYAVCTTVHYGLKPSTNCAIVTVEPQATLITADEDMSVSQANETTTQSSAQVPPQKTTEEMQKEAEQSGVLRVWHEFSWWYPWYRLHLNMSFSPPIELIFTPLALDVSIKIYDEQEFARRLEDAFDIGYDISWGIIIGSIVAKIAAHILGRSSLPSLFLAIGLDFVLQLALAYAANANQKTANTWLISFVASMFSAGGEAIEKCFKMIKWATSIGRAIAGSITSLFHSWWANGLAWDVITAIPFIFVDIILALIFYTNYSSGVVV